MYKPTSSIRGKEYSSTLDDIIARVQTRTLATHKALPTANQLSQASEAGEDDEITRNINHEEEGDVSLKSQANSLNNSLNNSQSSQSKPHYSIFNRGKPVSEMVGYVKAHDIDNDIGTVLTLDPFSKVPIVRVGSVSNGSRGTIDNSANNSGNNSVINGIDNAENIDASSVSPSKATEDESSIKSKALSTSTKEQRPTMLSQASQASQSMPKRKKKVKKCGRIQFESFYEQPKEEAIPDLICEMCAKVLANCYCEGCNEVFCQSCRELCHLKSDMGATLHPHEKLGLIRKLRVGDTSRIELTENYYMPNEEVFEEDMAKARDLSQPHALAMDKDVIVDRTVAITANPKYKARDIVLFIDPVTGQESYGRIISEWDFRHGQSAPAVVRGALPGVYYVVQMIDFVGKLGIQRLIELVAEPPPVVYPVLEGITDDPLKAAMHRAAEIDNKLRVSKIRKEFGPKWHYKPPNAEDLEPDDESAVKGGGRFYHLGLNNLAVEQTSDDSTVGSLTVASDARSKSKASQKASSKSPTKSGKGDSLVLSGSIRVNTNSGLVTNLSRGMQPDETPENYVDYVISLTAGEIPKYATSRHPSDALKSFSGGPDDDPERLIKKMHQLFVFAEADVCLPQERSNLLANQRFEFLYKFIDRRFIRIFQEMTNRAFNIWRENMEHLREVQLNFTARRIQKEIRRFLCRNVLQNMRDEIIARRYARWKKLHDQFDYCSKDTPGSVTMDHKLYFATAKKASRYAELCRIVLSKVLRHLHNRRLRSLREAVTTWRSVVTEFNEKNLKTSHIEAVAENVFGSDEVMSIATEQRIAFDLHKKLRDRGVSAIGNDSNAYVNVANMPLSLHRNIKQFRTADGAMDGSVDDTDENLFAEFESVGTHSLLEVSDIEGSLIDPPENDDGSIVRTPQPASVPVSRPTTQQNATRPGSVSGESSLGSLGKELSSMSVAPDDAVEFPPWNPSDGMCLPPLPKVNAATDAASRLTMSRADRVGKFSFEFQCEGPTKDSCWVIPGKLAMGPKLVDHHPNAGLKRTELTSQALMLIAGFSTYVSLMTPEEEAAVEKMYGIGPLKETLKNGHKEARASCNNMFIECKTTLSEEAEAMKLLPSLSQSHPDFNHYRQRRVRALGRIKRAEDGIALAKKQMKAVPGNYDIISMPIDQRNYPTIHELLPQLWELERRLAKGESLYIYSDDGHNRVGMLCGCLMGRLYALTPYETMFRIQACHDSAVRERERPVPVHCPSLPIEKQLITEVLSLTNRVYQGLTWRSHSDPESFADEHHQLIHGTLPVQGRFPFREPDGPTNRPKIPIYLEYNIINDVNSRIAASMAEDQALALGNAGSLSTKSTGRRMTRRAQRKLLINSASSKIRSAIASEKSIEPEAPSNAAAATETHSETTSILPIISAYDRGVSNTMPPEDLDAYFDKSIVRSARDIIKQIDRKVLKPAESANAIPLIMTKRPGTSGSNR